MSSSEDNLRLFAEFPPVSTSEWEAQIQADLKGADYEKKLIWKTHDGLKFRPYYRIEDTEALGHIESMAGEFPFVRGGRIYNNNWEIRQDIHTDDIEAANMMAVEAADRGANGIGFKTKKVNSIDDLSALIRYIDPEKTAVHFISSREYPYITELFIRIMKLRGSNPLKVKGSLGYDPFNYYLLYGNFYNSLEDNINEAVYLLTSIRKELPSFRIINVSGDVFHNAGAGIVQELAYALSSGNEYLSRLTDSGLTVDQIAPAMQFTFPLGSDYFTEIAKIRAARMLWSAIVKEYNPSAPETSYMYIHGTTSLRNKTLYDPWVNLLRGTTEAMSGAIAGCDSISVCPFDAAYSYPDGFSHRIARNTQIILKEESYLDKIADPSAGSYYIEKLTDSIATAAWDLFKKTEEEGGFLKVAGNGSLRMNIEATAKLRDETVARRATSILGTNQYPNTNEVMLDKYKAESLRSYPGLNLYRISGGYEEIRMATEQHVRNGNDRPSVFLLNIGNPSMRKARAGFATNFFGCAGFGIHDNNGFNSVDEAVEAAIISRAGIIVICSSDEEYGTIGMEVAVKLKSTANPPIVVVAGNPVDLIDDLKASGVDEFIHLRTNALVTLGQFQKMLGIV